MRSLFLLPVLFVLVACSEEVPKMVEGKSFDQGAYTAMVDLVDKIPLNSDEEPSGESWQGIPIKDLCFATIDEALQYQKEGEILMVPLSTSGRYATFLPVDYDRQKIEISSIYHIRGDSYGEEEVEFSHDFNFPVTVVYKRCGN